MRYMKKVCASGKMSAQTKKGSLNEKCSHIKHLITAWSGKIPQSRCSPLKVLLLLPLSVA
jgi:hypothetical protein